MARPSLASSVSTFVVGPDGRIEVAVQRARYRPRRQAASRPGRSDRFVAVVNRATTSPAGTGGGGPARSGVGASSTPCSPSPAICSSGSRVESRREEIAARADVPIGTLYQFFANKYVIVCELDRQDTVAVQAELVELGSAIPSLDWPALLSASSTISRAVAARPVRRRAVWLAGAIDPATRATAALNEQALAEQVEHILARDPAPGGSAARRLAVGAHRLLGAELRCRRGRIALVRSPSSNA